MSTASDHDRPFDVGLQPERTLLAWRRTCLALVVGNAGMVRYLGPLFGPGVIVAGSIGLILAGTGWVLATVRYGRAHRGLIHRGDLGTGGTLGLIAAGSALAAALGGVLIVLAAD